jgi:hypothetical protein
MFFRWQHLMFLCLFTLYSPRVGALVIVLSDSPHKKSDNWRLFQFLRGQIVDSCLAGAKLLSISRATVTKLMSALHESWEDNTSQEEHWAKINTDRKKLPNIEKDCFEKSHNHCSTGDSRTECSPRFYKNCPTQTSHVQPPW